MKIPNIEVRQYIYAVVVAAIPVLLIAGAIAPEDVEVWLQLAAAALGLGTTTQAAIATRAQRKTGEVDPGRPAEPGQ